MTHDNRGKEAIQDSNKIAGFKTEATGIYCKHKSNTAPAKSDSGFAAHRDVDFDKVRTCDASFYGGHVEHLKH